MRIGIRPRNLCRGRVAQRRRCLLQCAPLTHSKTCYTSSVILGRGVSPMRRREFIVLVGSSVAGWPLAARAQQPAVPVIGFLHQGSPDASESQLDAFRQGLKEGGFVEGQNAAIEYRWAEGQYDRLPDLARDLVRRQVAVITAVGTSAPGLAVKSATSVIPVVFQTGGDPVQDGLVSRMNRPGGNVTGVSRLSVALEPKRLELLHQVVPKASVIGFLVNPLNPRTQLLVQQMREPVRSLGLSLDVLEASAESELDTALASTVQRGVGALLVAQEPSYNRWHEYIVTLAARHVIRCLQCTRAAFMPLPAG